MDHFHYRDRTLYCEDVPVAELAETVRHAAVRLQQGDAAAPPEADPDGVRRGQAAHLLQRQDQRQPQHLPADGRARGRLRRHQRRRAVPRPQGRRRRRRRSSSPASARPTPRSATRLENGVFLFNVESEAELHTLGEVAKAMGARRQVALRVNPDLPPKTHAKTDTRVKGVKFGLDIETVAGRRAGRRRAPGRRGRRPAHAPRLADPDGRAVPAGVREGRGADRARSASRATRSST